MMPPALKDRSELESLQLTKLRRLLAALRENNPFYAERLRRADLGGSIESIARFMTRMPFTTKRDLIEDQQEHAPYGSNLTFPLDQYVRLHQTSSTTGKPLRWLDTRESWSAMVDAWVQVLEASSVTASDRLFAAFSFGPFIGFWMGYEAAIRIGCLTIPGGAMNTVTRLRAILANDVTVLCCTPTYAIRLGEVAREVGLDLSLSKVRAIVVGGEPGGSVPAVRARIESMFAGATVFDHHGMTEIGPATYQCPGQIGTLHLLEASLLCEFVDPASGKPLPPDSGEVGELVVTTLDRVGSPLLRYRTGDLVQPGPLDQCMCGRVHRRLIGGVMGRADDMIFVRGVNLYPSAVEQIIRSQPGVAEYQVQVTEERGMSELTIRIEPEREVATPAHLREAIAGAFRDTLNLRVPVELAAPDSLPRFEFKARRWVRGSSEVPA